jgi:hypothetical protein
MSTTDMTDKTNKTYNKQVAFSYRMSFRDKYFENSHALIHDIR